MTTISFTVVGSPVPKGRPRTVRRGNKTITYTPDKTRDYEDYVRSVASQYAPKELLKGALEMELHFFFQKPKSLPKRVVYHIKRPDVDNFAKALLDSLEPRKRPLKSQDCLEGAMYENDAQIVSLWVTKEYGEPRVEVKITDDVRAIENNENEELSEEKVKEIKAMEKRVIERITEPERWEE